MRKGIITLFCLYLSGCAGIAFKEDVEQGQSHLKKHVSQLSIGMSKKQVTHIMGVPSLVSPKDPDHWTYIHSSKQQHKSTEVSYVSVSFEKDHLATISPIHHS